MDIALGAGLDLLIAAIFAVFILLGIRRGLIKSVISLAGNIAALIIALIFSVQLGAYINSHFVEAPMKDWLLNQMSSDPESVKTDINSVNLDSLFTDSPEFFTNLCNYLGIDKNEMHMKYESFKANGVEQAKSAVIDLMIKPVSTAVSRVIAFVIIFIACIIILKIVFWLASFIAHIPIIRKLDKLGGAIFGAVSALLIVFIVISVINIASPYIMKDRSIAEKEEIFNKTIIYKNMSKINPLKLSFGDNK